MTSMTENKICCTTALLNPICPHNNLTLLIGPGAQARLEAGGEVFSKSSNYLLNQYLVRPDLHNVFYFDYLTPYTSAELTFEFPVISHLTIAVNDVDVNIIPLLRWMILSWNSHLTSLRLYIRLGSNPDYFSDSWKNSGKLLELLGALPVLQKLAHLTVVFEHAIFTTNVDCSTFPLDLSPFFGPSGSLREFNFSTEDDVRMTPLLDWLLKGESESGNCNLQRIAIGNPDEHFTVFNRLLADCPRLCRKLVELPNLGCRALSSSSPLNLSNFGVF